MLPGLGILHTISSGEMQHSRVYFVNLSELSLELDIWGLKMNVCAENHMPIPRRLSQ